MRHPAHTADRHTQTACTPYSLTGYKALRMLATARIALSGAVNGLIIAVPFLLYAFDIIPFR